TGHLVWKHDQQPCQSLVPVANGFFSIYDRVFGGSFLEHADVNGLYDWGMSYNRDAASLYRVVALPFHKNSFYYVASSSGDFGFNLVIDRFVTDIAFQNIGVESRHNHVGVTLKLNAPAPSGGIVVKLYSNSDKLLMPNGTQQETFRVEPGETDREIRLRAQEVTSNTTVTLLGVSDGIR